MTPGDHIKFDLFKKSIMPLNRKFIKELPYKCWCQKCQEFESSTWPVHISDVRMRIRIQGKRGGFVFGFEIFGSDHTPINFSFPTSTCTGACYDQMDSKQSDSDSDSDLDLRCLDMHITGPYLLLHKVTMIRQYMNWHDIDMTLSVADIWCRGGFSGSPDS